MRREAARIHLWRKLSKMSLEGQVGYLALHYNFLSQEMVESRDVRCCILTFSDNGLKFKVYAHGYERTKVEVT
jgi:hypothetical protein